MQWCWLCAVMRRCHLVSAASRRIFIGLFRWRTALVPERRHAGQRRADPADEACAAAGGCCLGLIVPHARVRADLLREAASIVLEVSGV